MLLWPGSLQTHCPPSLPPANALQCQRLLCTPGSLHTPLGLFLVKAHWFTWKLFKVLLRGRPERSPGSQQLWGSLPLKCSG